MTTKKKATVKQRSSSWKVGVSGSGSEWYVDIYRPDGRFWCMTDTPYTERNKALRAAKSLCEQGLEMKG